MEEDKVEINKTEKQENGGENTKGRSDEEENIKKENKEDFFASMLGKDHPISNIINNFYKEVKNIKTEDLEDFSTHITEGIKKDLETKFKKAYDNEENQSVKNFADLIMKNINEEDETCMGKNDRDELKKNFHEFFKNGEFKVFNLAGEQVLNSENKVANKNNKVEVCVEELLQCYLINQNERRIIKDKIDNLSEEKKKEFWAQYYDIPIQTVVNNKIESINEKLEDLILETQIIRKKMGN